MRIHTRVVFDMNTLETVHDESYEYEGPVVECKGPSGKIAYPQYVEDQHLIWLNQIDTIIDAALIAASPFSGENAFDPTTLLTATQGRYDTYIGLVDALNPVTDFNTFIDAATDKVDTTLINTATIKTARDEFENRKMGAYQRSVSRIVGPLSQVGADNGAGFTVALALLENDRQKQVDEFDANITLKAHGDRAGALIRSVEFMVNMLGNRIASSQAASQTLEEINRVSIVAQKEQKDRDLEIDVQDSLFDIKLFQYGANMIGAPGGSAVPNNEISTAQSALSGAFSGAAIGASFGPVGAGIGAALGGLGGLLAG